VIEVFADIWCPFAYVGLTIARQLRDARAPGTPIAVRAWPLELVNGEPQDPERAAEHVRDLRAQLGVDLFNGFDASRFPTTTLPALAFVAAAQRSDRGEEASYNVRAALWEQGLDIGDAAVVSALAQSFDTEVTDADRAAVLSDWHEGERRGVVGSPHFFCGGRDKFCPGLQIERNDAGELLVAPNRAEFEAFLESCWTA
jgi:predicted DsbA family dithiol-disulfide isomerase